MSELKINLNSTSLCDSIYRDTFIYSHEASATGNGKTYQNWDHRRR